MLQDRDSSDSQTQVATLAALESPIFKRLWAASWSYYTYRSMELAVLVWLVLEITNSPFQVALVSASRAAPMFFLGLFAGSIADRFSKYSVMAVGQFINICAVIFISLLLFLDEAKPVPIYFAVGLTGFAWALDFIARRAYLASLFKGRSLTNAMSLDSGALISSNLTGPILGTALIRWSGFSGAYIGIAFLALLGFVLMLSLNRDQRTTIKGVNPLLALSEAISTAKAHKNVAAVVLLTAVFNIFAWPITTQIPVIARNDLDAPEIMYGLLVGGIGAGAIAGAILLAKFNPKRRGYVYTAGTLLFLIASFIFALSPWYLASLTLLFIAGMGLVCFATMQPLLVVEAVPPELRGRALGAVALAIGVSPPGMLGIGIAAGLIGSRSSVAILTFIGIIVVAFVAWRYPVLRE